MAKEALQRKKSTDIHELLNKSSKINKKYWLEDWAENSHFHGFYEAYFARSSAERIFWTCLIITCTGFGLWQIIGLIRDYRTEPHYSSRVYMANRNYALFPNITICKFSRAHKDRVQELNISSKALAHLFVSMIYSYDFETIFTNTEGDSAIQLPQKLIDDQLSAWEEYYTRPGGIKDVKEIVKYMGFNCTDLMLDCRFSFHTFNCCKFAVPVVNQYGLCWVINVPSDHSIPRQTFNGALGGLRMIMRMDSENEFNEPENLMFNNYLEEGLILIPSFDPYTSHPANPIVLDPGMHSWITLSNRISYHEEPQFTIFPRECATQPKLKYLKAEYTSYNCMLECTLYAVYTDCDCVWVAETIDNLKTCNGTAWKDCALPAIGSRSRFFDGCMSNCREPCESRIESSASVTSARWPSRKYKEPIERIIASTTKYRVSIEDAHATNIYFPSLVYVMEEKTEKMPLFQMIGNIGGQLGLWVGVSVMTLFQGFYYVFRHIYDVKRERFKRTLEKINQYRARSQSMPGSAGKRFSVHPSPTIDVSEVNVVPRIA